MPFVIEIQNPEVFERTVTSKRDGKTYTFYQQEAWYHDGVSPYPSRCFVPVSSLSAGYRPGRYTLSGDALFVDRFGKLALANRFSLVSVGE